jgi:MazG family protein
MSHNYSTLNQLQELVAELRDKDNGCPWILIQTLKSLASLTIEESYELADSIIEGKMSEIKDELSDVLLHIMLYAQLGEELGEFDLEQIATAAIAKQLRRKPVFKEHAAKTPAEALTQWEENKRKERAEHTNTQTASVLDCIPPSLPSLQRAIKLQSQAAKIGFDWPTVEPIFAKITEEIAELQVEISQDDKQKITDEFGDLLFAVVNLARHLNIDPEIALLQANKKFTSRFKSLESTLKKQGKLTEKTSLEAMDEIWEQIKKIEN